MYLFCLGELLCLAEDRDTTKIVMATAASGCIYEWNLRAIILERIRKTEMIGAAYLKGAPVGLIGAGQKSSQEQSERDCAAPPEKEFVNLPCTRRKSPRHPQSQEPHSLSSVAAIG